MTKRARELNRRFDEIIDLPCDQQAIAIARERPSLQQELRVLIRADVQAGAKARGGEADEVTLRWQSPQAGDTSHIAAEKRVARLTPYDATAPAPLEAIVTAGTRIDQYEVIRELGRGGMGTVFLARDTKLGRKVAVKFLDSTDSPSMVQRFVMEARATAQCTHENIVIIHDVDVFQEHPYMVLEYLKGKPLSTVMAHGRIPPYRAIELMIPVVRALICAHESHIVHRDLKPDNIFQTDTGVIKVLDFGIAKLVREPRTGQSSQRMDAETHGTAGTKPSIHLLSDLTEHGALVGTMSFMSPEQWCGHGIDHRTDIWAIGILLWIMIIGRHPLAPLRGMQLSVTALAEQHMPSARTARVRMPREVADVIDTCLRKDKCNRFKSARELLEVLEALRPGHMDQVLDACGSPYAGLTAFQETDADRFFGRSREIASVLARVQDTPLIAVVGLSGVGKSSFVRAGAIPALKRSGEPWEAIVVRPGRHPMAALANIVAPMITDDSATLSERVAEHQSVLARLSAEPGYLGTVLRERASDNDRKTVLFVDQFEELYTLNEEHERLAFTACLSGMADDAASPLRVIASIRSDFLDRVAEDQRFMAELSQGLFFLTPPGRNGLRDALVQPAEMLGYSFESSSIVENMLDALEETPGALPLLQFTAAKLWDKRDTRRRLLTEQSYHEIGGIVGALASHADAVLSRLTPDAQQLVRTIFLRLVTSEHTRDIVSVGELCELSPEPDAIERLVGELVDARLLVVQRGDASIGRSVEIVHESMIHSWPTLMRWLDEGQDDAAFLQQLWAVAKQWHDKGRPSGLLWRGEAADEARRWQSRYQGKLTSVQEAYLACAMELNRRSVRRRHTLIVSSFVILLGLAIAATVALLIVRHAQQEARDQADAAIEAEITVREQLQIIQDKENERQSATKAAQQSGAELKIRNRELEIVNSDLERARRVAEEEKLRAEQKEAIALAALRQVEKTKEALEKEKNAAEKSRDEAEKARQEAEDARDKHANLVEIQERQIKRLEDKHGKAVDKLK